MPDSVLSAQRHDPWRDQRRTRARQIGRIIYHLGQAGANAVVAFDRFHVDPALQALPARLELNKMAADPRAHTKFFIDGAEQRMLGSKPLTETLAEALGERHFADVTEASWTSLEMMVTALTNPRHLQTTAKLEIYGVGRRALEVEFRWNSRPTTLPRRRNPAPGNSGRG